MRGGGEVRNPLVALVFAVASSPALSERFVAGSSLPFSYEILAVDDVLRDGEAWTVATIRIKNGAHYVRSITFSCEAENADGYTWDVRGDVAGVLAGVAREFKLVAYAGDPAYWSGAVKMRCNVAAFDASL